MQNWLEKIIDEEKWVEEDATLEEEAPLVIAGTVGEITVKLNNNTTRNIRNSINTSIAILVSNKICKDSVTDAKTLSFKDDEDSTAIAVNPGSFIILHDVFLNGSHSVDSDMHFNMLVHEVGHAVIRPKFWTPSNYFMRDLNSDNDRHAIDLYDQVFVKRLLAMGYIQRVEWLANVMGCHIFGIPVSSLIPLQIRCMNNAVSIETRVMHLNMSQLLAAYSDEEHFNALPVVHQKICTAISKLEIYFRKENPEQ